ncbi:hypothetical protein CYLTODRAFT_489915 [Cylindrobasidium torrendii FP15055 ss-10]|uniref:Uncharacterized protein n=1 Tax=Cylindrobasidium torrendii FP15055 ss-10 TaxID=1314674 RepID=A0A0D7BDK6_9AGAR|nr:hypothetical protein CYLTODRAFT_489915 [Cylindrobasidium torrendii FP15055 ss-10]
MHPTLRVSRHPLIRFLGKRVWSSSPEAPHAHPAGLPLPSGWHTASSSSKTPSAGSGSAYGEFWHAPQRFWPKSLSEDDITLVLTGGASKW